MRDAEAAFQPLIHCTPPTDPAFLACASRAYGEAAEILSGEAAVFVGTLLRLRTHYPAASIIPLSLAVKDAPSVVWLVSREGWAELEPEPPPSAGVAGTAATTGQTALPRS